MDIFDLCDCLDDNSVDMILSDLPYGITACEWDTVIPFEPMWDAFKRIIKPRGAIVLTASQPFTSQLVMSNLEWFRQELVWDKVLAVGFLDANRQHLKRHENIIVFSQGFGTYNPQMKPGKPYKKKRKITPIYNKFIPIDSKSDGGRYPTSVIQISNADRRTQHPTQKPVALFEYLIRTYTQPGDVVFDPCVGSGTTALGARNTGRNYIVGDNSAEYVEIARKRLAAPYTLSMFDEQPKQDETVQQMEMFNG
jgi:site-specific DNA-methyltransferase (adenine-specific)